MARNKAAMLLMMTTLAAILAAAGQAAAQAQPGNGGPFQDFQQSQLVFVPPSNVTQVNGATFDMVDGLKSECNCHPSCWHIKVVSTATAAAPCACMRARGHACI
jgi:hypothetical protein